MPRVSARTRGHVEDPLVARMGAGKLLRVKGGQGLLCRHDEPASRWGRRRSLRHPRLVLASKGVCRARRLARGDMWGTRWWPVWGPENCLESRVVSASCAATMGQPAAWGEAARYATRGSYWRQIGHALRWCCDCVCGNEKQHAGGRVPARQDDGFDPRGQEGQARTTRRCTWRASSGVMTW
jgi:hypothetical protein